MPTWISGPTAAEIRWLAKNFATLDEAARKQVNDFLTALDDHDEVHRVYAAFK
jgi:transcriptional/translational regulatory protein YebC/TACO1